MRIQWHGSGKHLGSAMYNAKKLQVLTLLDAKEFPTSIFIDWGQNSPLFAGEMFYVKEAKIVATNFNQSATDVAKVGNQSKPILKASWMLQPTDVTQQVTLVRVDPPGYGTHSDELLNLIDKPLW
jgi:hypothetical protein